MHRISSTRWTLSILLATTLLGASCSKKDSETTETGTLQARFVATAMSSGFTEVTASLSVPPFQRVTLTGGDLLVATMIDPMTSAENEQVLMTDRILLIPRYFRTFAGNQKDTRIELTLNRTETGRASLDSYVTLPTPFELRWVSSPVTGDPAPLEISRSSAAERYVLWDPHDAPEFEPGDDLSFSITGTCIESYAGSIDWEQGEDALELTQALFDRPAPDDGQTCEIEIEFTLSRQGVIDQAYQSGSFVGEQVRTLKLLSRP